MRKTKIICTLGPACESEEIMRELVLAGMDVARMNFSHGSYQEHKNRIDMLKKIREETGRPVALLLDTKGPEIRIGKFKDGAVTLSAGDSFILAYDDILGDKHKVSMSYKGLYQDVKKVDRILVDDGLIELEVIGIVEKDVHCVVLNGGILGNTRDQCSWSEINLPSITEQDIEDIKFGIENDVDFIAASFVRKAEDVIEIRKVLDKYKGQILKSYPKLKTARVNNIDEILLVWMGSWWPVEIWGRNPSRRSTHCTKMLIESVIAAVNLLLPLRKS